MPVSGPGGMAGGPGGPPSLQGFPPGAEPGGPVPPELQMQQRLQKLRQQQPGGFNPGSLADLFQGRPSAQQPMAPRGGMEPSYFG